jgi:hypothetical protein
MVEGVTSGGRVGVVAIAALRYAQSDGQDVILPVRPSQAVYANFRHIQVRPDSRLEDGIPLYKLKILDTLIEQLSRSKGTAGAADDVGTREANAKTVDTLIANLASTLRAGTAPGASYRRGFFPAPGAFVDLVA